MDRNEISRIDRQLNLLELSDDPVTNSLAPYLQDYLYTSLVSMDPSLRISELKNVAPGELSKFLDKSKVGGGDPISDMLSELKKPPTERSIQERVAEDLSRSSQAPSAALELERQAEELEQVQLENDLKLEESRRALDQAEIFSGRNVAQAPGIAAELSGLGQDTSTLNLDPQVEINSNPINAVSDNVKARARSNQIVKREQNSNIKSLNNQANFVRSFERNIENTRKTIEKALLQGLSIPRDTKEGSNPNG